MLIKAGHVYTYTVLYGDGLVLTLMLRHSLARVGSLHVVGVDVDVWNELVEDASG